jgi:hypothetical protein
VTSAPGINPIIWAKSLDPARRSFGSLDRLDGKPAFGFPAPSGPAVGSGVSTSEPIGTNKIVDLVSELAKKLRQLKQASLKNFKPVPVIAGDSVLVSRLLGKQINDLIAAPPHF